MTSSARPPIAILIAAVLAVVAAGWAQSASAVPARPAAIQQIDVRLIGDENDGSYAWDGMKDPWETDADALFVRSGQSRIFFIWPPNNGSHDVNLRKSQSTPGVTFPAGAVLHQNYGTEDEYWPNGGWVPLKVGTYRLYCSKHTSMKMRVIVAANVARIAAGARTLKAGVRRVRATVTAAAATSSTIEVLKCLNSSCSRSRKVASSRKSLRSGANGFTLATPALAAGSYRVRSVSADVTLSAPFSVKGSSSGPRFTG